MMQNKKDNKGMMAIKVDLEKAYDRVSWTFHRDTLADIGLKKSLINIIMSCVFTAQ